MIVRRIVSDLRPTLLALLIAWLVMVLPIPVAQAVEVTIEVSSREVWVGVPFRVSIVISDAEDFQTPAMPDVAGLRFLGSANQNTSSMTQIINGRMTQSRTITLTWQAVADSPGEFVIPPITVNADGNNYRTRPLGFVATKSETGDLLFVEVEADRQSYYLGETIDLKLQIWLRPYRDRQVDVELGKQDMWQLVDKRTSAWGVFADALDSATVREALRADSEGDTRAYFVYEVRHSFTPRQTGQLVLDDVRIVVDYPEKLGVRRDFFGSRQLQVEESRPVVAGVEASAITIEAPPEEGRPDFYAGAVGRFDMVVTAKPREVAVGDPITLNIQIIDRTGGGVSLDLLQPPPLNRVKELNENFTIPTDPLAGVLNGSVKAFTQTVRARHDQVTEIPSIPFASFDPDRGQYVVVRSDPIPITVRPTATLSMTEVVEAEGPGQIAATELTEAAGGILANYTGADELLAQQDVTMPRAVGILILLFPPLAYLITFVTQRRIRRLRGDTAYARRRKARPAALNRIRQAAAAGAQEQAERAAAAVRDYVADRCNLATGAATAEEVIDRLRHCRVDNELIEQVENLFRDCEQLTYAGGGESAAGDPAGRARRCILCLEREKLR